MNIGEFIASIDEQNGGMPHESDQDKISVVLPGYDPQHNQYFEVESIKWSTDDGGIWRITISE